MENKIKKLKKFLQENYPNMQAYNTKNIAGDYMENVYDEDNIKVDYYPEYGYIEIFGLTNDEFEDLLDKDSYTGNHHLKTFNEYKIQNKIDIQVGDRITYIDKQEKKCIITVLEDKGELSDNKDNPIKEILKIERPRYEVVEEKKELLTEEEKEFLKTALMFGNYGEETKNGVIKFIEKRGYYIYFYHDEWASNSIYIDKNLYFKNLEEDRKYTLQELGLD